MTGTVLPWQLGLPSSAGSSSSKDSGRDAGTEIRSAWEFNGTTACSPSIAEDDLMYVSEERYASASAADISPETPLQIVGSPSLATSPSLQKHHLWCNFLTTDNGRQCLGGDSDGEFMEHRASSQTKKQKFMIHTRKLMEGILDQEQSRAVRTLLCVDPESLQGRCLRLVQTHSFTYAVSFVVIVNAVFIGIETEVRRCDDSMTFSAWYVGQVAFSLIFVVELGIRLFAERSSFWRDAWNGFDTVLVLASVADTLVLHHLVSGSTLDLIVALRITRLARLVRIFRLLRFFKELWFLVAGIFDATRTLAWAWLLICFMTYIPAIFATRIFGKRHESDEFLQDQFGTIPRSMYTLFTVLTMEGWAEIARETMKVEAWSWMFFILFIFSTTFALMNVVVAVIVQNTLEHASHCREEENQKSEQLEHLILAKIVEVFEAADTDGDGDLTRKEFLQSLNNARVVRHLHEIGVDVRQAEHLFDILDYDESGCLDLLQFVEGVLRARGEAKAKDVLAVQCDLWRVENRLMDKVDESVTHINDQLGPSGLMGALSRLKQDISIHPLPSPKAGA